MDKEKNFVSAVVYCCNDADRIESFIRNLDRTLSDNFLKYEIVVVNDSSDDESAKIVKDYTHHIIEGGEEHTISILNMSYRQGLEASMNAGLNLTIGDFVFEFDSVNDDYDWTLLMEVYYHSLTGFDIVSAKSNRKPRLMSRIYYYFFNRYAHLQYHIGPESFRILSRRAINRIHSITQSIPYRKAAYANSGLSVDSLTYQPKENISRKRYNDRRIVAVESLLLFTDVPFRATMALAILMFAVSAAVGIYAVVYKFMSNPVEGWTTTIFFLAFGFSGLFIILSMALRYMQTIVRLIFRKKDYLFESIEKLQ
jgi:dolichol-phosphate mannosyltransferase